MMPILSRSKSLRKFCALLIVPLLLLPAGLGCSKATESEASEALESEAPSASEASEVVISEQPASITVKASSKATFSVVAEGDDLSFQWKRNGKNIPGAIEDTYTIASVKASDNGAKFSVIVSDANGQRLTSDEAKLSIQGLPTVPDAEDDTDDDGTGTTTPGGTGSDTEGDGEDDADGITTKPVIHTFGAESPSIRRGMSTILRWEVSQATSVSIDNDVRGSVTETSITVSPEKTTVYTLTATNRLGSVNSRIQIRVEDEVAPADPSDPDEPADPADPTPADPVDESLLPVIESFTASSNQLRRGSPALLNWTTQNADEVWIDGLTRCTSYGNSVLVRPTETTVYILSARNQYGTSTAQVKITVNANPCIGYYNSYKSCQLPPYIKLLLMRRPKLNPYACVKQPKASCSNLGSTSPKAQDTAAKP